MLNIGKQHKLKKIGNFNLKQMNSTIYIISKYSENQWLEKDGKWYKYFVIDIDDINLAVKEYCKDLEYILKENSINWDKNKMEITWNYFQTWDVKKEYEENDYFNIQEIKHIKKLI